jgi:UDP:flavonoid glycosyltransferase YjiC (YdhE family)
MPEMSGLPEEKLTPGYYYTGPIFALMDMPIPAEVEQVFQRPGVNIFCSLGSSGFPETLKMIIQALRSIPEYNIVCSTTTILDPAELGAPSDNFYACRYLPAHLINEMADIAVTHGGQGTIQTAVWAGTPVVGIGFQAEQQANIDGIAKAGMAIRIPIFSLNERRLLRAVEKIQKPHYTENAKKLQQKLRETDGVKRSVELMNDYILGKL